MAFIVHRSVLAVATCFMLGIAGQLPAASVPSGDASAAIGRLRAAGIEGGVLKETYWANGYLRVTYELSPERGSLIRCELALPDPADWDGRLWGHGNGGWAGNVLSLRGMFGDKSAHAMCDMGTSRSDGANMPESAVVLRDFAWRATHLMTVESKRLVGIYYGRGADRCYFTGASTGGRQAIVEALRFPEDYDGIVAHVPSIPPAATAALAWRLARMAKERGAFTAEERKAVRDGELAYFSKIDPEFARGVFIVDPRPTPGKLDGCWREIVRIAPAMASRESCWRELFEPVVVGGRRLCAGMVLGAEFACDFGPMLGKHYGAEFGDIANVTERELLLYADNYGQMSEDDTDLSAFRARGGKLIMLAGYEDKSCPAGPINEWYDAVVARTGGIDATRSFFVHYAEPGRTHGAQGAAYGAGQIGWPRNANEKIVDWVEKGVAPGDMAFAWPKAGKNLVVAPYPDVSVRTAPLSWRESLSAALPERFSGKVAADCRKTVGNGLMTCDMQAREVSNVCRPRTADGVFDVSVSLSFDGKEAASAAMVERPGEFEREGLVDGWKVSTRLVMVAGVPSAGMKVTVENTADRKRDVAVGLRVSGADAPATAVRWTGGDAAEATLRAVAPGQRRTLYAAIAVGGEAGYLADKVMEDGEGLFAHSRATYGSVVGRIADETGPFDLADEAKLADVRSRLRAAMTRLPAAGGKMATWADKPMDKVRIAFVGVGGRGSAAVERLCRIPGVEVAALCDVRASCVAGCQAVLRAAGRPPAREFVGETAWRECCRDAEADVVYVATHWALHAPVALMAMESGKHALVEVPAAMTLAECQALVETSERTERHCMMLENAVYTEYELLVKSAVAQGAVGEPVYAEGAYIHDQRHTQFTRRWNSWRIRWNMDHGGDQYPTHGLGPVALALDINRGDRMVSLVSLGSGQFGMAAWAKEHLDPTNEFYNAKIKMSDTTVTLIRTAKGRLIRLRHDVTNPHPHDEGDFVQGTKGAVGDFPLRAMTEEFCTGPGWKWMDAVTLDKFRVKYMHPLWKTAGEVAAQGGGHGGCDYLMDLRWVYCLRNGLPLDMNVYDLAAWCSVCELSERSEQGGGVPQEIPDFTRGAWRTTPPVDLWDMDLSKAGVRK